MRFTWRAQGCGVRLAWPARRGDRYEYSVFFAERPRRVGRAAIRGGGQLVRASHPFAIRLEDGYSSALDPVMFRARLRLRAAGGPVRIDHCR